MGKQSQRCGNAALDQSEGKVAPIPSRWARGGRERFCRNNAKKLR
jgi:hypothetical protein